VLAGAVAFRLFVYLLPLFLTVVTLLGRLESVSDGPGDLGVDLGLSAYLVGSVDAAAEQSRRSLWVLVPLTVWAVCSGGLGAAKVLQTVHALAWEQPLTRLRRGWLAAGAAFGFAVVVGGVLAGLQ
jgi:hypothetical protein